MGGSPKRRWEDNIKIDLIEIGYEGLLKDRVKLQALNPVKMFPVLQKTGKFSLANRLLASQDGFCYI
jgi:hypothetical protein